jgi:hypothetical protein
MNENAEIDNAIVDTIHQVIRDTYSLSQGGCPVRTGYLRSTGYYFETPDGGEAGYKCNYARSVESGILGGIQTVKAHTRDRSRRLHWVREHKRNMPTRIGRRFLSTAGRMAFSNFGTILFNELRRRFREVR